MHIFEKFILENPDHVESNKIFKPFAWKKFVNSYSVNQRFVHYTSAHTAMLMCENKEIWLRKSNVMNDFMEIEYGFDCLNNALVKNSESIKYLFKDISDGSLEKITEWYNGWLPHFRNDTYIFCLSEHYENEDKTGRLSMWRAYGGDAGVAVVLSPTAILSPSDALGAYSSPVAYLGREEFSLELMSVIENIKSKKDYIKAQDSEYFYNNICDVFRDATLCTKHPGFREEAEWRIIYSPSFNSSPRITKEVKSINGVVQPICRIPLIDIPDEGLVGLSIPDLIDRIIVGPSEHPEVMAEAFIELLTAAGVENAQSKVITSDIPLRR